MSSPTDWFELAKSICVPDPRAKEVEESKTLDSADADQQTRPAAPEILRLPRR